MTDLAKEAPGSQAAEVWQVGDLTIDVGRQRVTRGEAEIPLPRLSFDLLLTLARRSPNVVSSDELMSEVWPRLVVGPETVVQRVKLLRQALDDRSDEPRYIAALRSRGYRLVADARRVARAAAPVAAEAPPPPETPSAKPQTEPAVDSTAAPTIAPVPPAAPRPAPPTGGRTARKLAAAVAVAAMVLVAGWLALRDTDPDHRPAATTAATGVATDADRTVAVLPFSNLSPDARDAYLALSLPEMTLNRLTALPGLRVIARESSFLAGREATDPREIGRKLDAAYLVSGSVQRSGDALRVTVRLVDARDATQLWSRDLEGRVADVFRIQDEIAEQVTAALQSRIANVGVAGPPQPRSQNVEAYLAYLRGRAAIRRFTVVEAESAAREFERAIELDPTFAAAQAALYDARMQAAGLRHDDLDAARRRHRGLLERALELDPQSGPAWFARAMWEDLDLGDRDAAFRRAMALDPGNTRGLVAFSEYLDITDKASDGGRVPGSGFDPSSWRARAQSGSVKLEGRAAEAQRVLEQALRIDPLSPRALFRKAMREFRQSFVSAEPPILAILENDPEFYPALQRVANYRAMFHGHPAEAIPLIERAIRSDPQNPWGPHTATAFYLDTGDYDAARAVAATTPVSAETAKILLAQYVGDWRTAGEVAMSRWGFEWGFAESRGSFQALRDYALRKRDFGRPVQLLRERYNLPTSGAVAISLGNFRPAVHLAHLELAQGNKARAEETLHAVIRWIDADNKAPPAFKMHTRAQAMMLLGDRERALADLAASYRDDNDYNQWWYVLERDPVFEPLHDDTRYKVLLAEVRAWAARERETVEQLRREGKVPVRRAAAGR